MNTDVTVVIAYRDMGVEARRRSFAYVRDYYLRLRLPIVVSGGDSDNTFTRASAINAGIRTATGRIIIQSDPDSLVPEQKLRTAVDLAAEADGLVVPHDRYLYLTEPATNQILAGRPPFAVDPEQDCGEYGINGVGNVTVFSRTTWEQAGGFDERCGLWSGDDACFAYAAAAYCQPTRRLAGDMVHLWHPVLPQSVPGAPGYAEQFSIVASYRDASTVGPEAVRQLVASR